MNLLLQIIEGPRQGTRHLLPEGTTFVIGRGREADLGIPEDRFLSRRHVALLHRDGHWWVQDLNSSNGSTLDDQPLAEITRLQTGQTISAGHTRIRVALQSGEQPAAPTPAPPSSTTATTEEPATVLRRNTTTLGDLAISLFALVDSHRYPELTTTLDQLAAPGHCTGVGDGDGAASLRLLTLGGHTDLLQELLARQRETGGVVLFSSDADLPVLARHLADMLQVETGDGQRLRFRYYLPQVLEAFLTHCPAELAARFFGPIRLFLLSSADAGTLTAFSRTDKGVTRRTLPIEKLCLS